MEVLYKVRSTADIPVTLRVIAFNMFTKPITCWISKLKWIVLVKDCGALRPLNGHILAGQGNIVGVLGRDPKIIALYFQSDLLFRSGRVGVSRLLGLPCQRQPGPVACDNFHPPAACRLSILGHCAMGGAGRHRRVR